MKTKHFLAFSALFLGIITSMFAQSGSCDSVNTDITSKFRYLGTWNNQGTPDYLMSEGDDVSQALLDYVNEIAPEGEDLHESSPEYFSEETQLNTVITQSTDVYLTFVHEGAGWKNVLGFYTYPQGQAPQTINDIDSLTFIFPNVSKEGNVLQPGDKVHLGHFEAGTVIGYFLMAKGWTGSEACLNSKAHFVFTDKHLNTFTTSEFQQQTILLNYKQENILLLGIEDIRRPEGDQDFNDAVFYLSSDPVGIDTTDVPEVATATLRGEASICDGEEAILAIDFTGTAPWSVIYTNGNDTVEVKDILTDVYEFTTTEPGHYNLVDAMDALGRGIISGSALVNSQASFAHILNNDTTLCPGTLVEVVIQITQPLTYEPGCARTIGYWKNHSGKGPQDDMISAHLPIYLGNEGGSSTRKINNVNQALQALNMELGHPSNGITKLYAQLTAAKLNLLNCSLPSPDEVNEADDYLADLDHTDWEDLVLETKNEILDIMSALDDFNNNRMPVPGVLSDLLYNLDGEETRVEGIEENFMVLELSAPFELELISISNAQCVTLLSDRITVTAYEQASATLNSIQCISEEEAVIVINFDGGVAPFTFQYSLNGNLIDTLVDTQQLELPVYENGEFSMVSLSDANCEGITTDEALIIDCLDYKRQTEAMISPMSCLGEELNLGLSVSELLEIESISWSSNGLGSILDINATETVYVPAAGESGVVDFTALVQINGETFEVNGSVEIRELPDAGFQYSPETVFTEDEVVFTADANEMTSYTWLVDGEELSGVQASYTFMEAGIYEVTLIVHDGFCTAEETREVEVLLKNAIYVPNVFNPQSSNAENRVVKVYGNNILEEGFSFRIFNRWGTELYSTNSFINANQNGWNGADQDNGEDQSLATFSYILKGNFEDGSKINMTGTITLVN